MNMRDIREPGPDILRNALEALRRATGLVAEVLPDTYEKGNCHRRDAEVCIALPGYDKEWHFIAEVKTIVTRGTLGVTRGHMELFRNNKRLGEKGLLVTRYVTPQMADELRGNNIQFVDTTGNTYLNDPPLYVFVKGNKPAGRAFKETSNRAFRPAGLQVIFALLCLPGMENAPFRAIAKAANVALGTVGWVMKGLKQLGHLVDMGGRGRRLVRKKDLLDRWVAAYPDQLRPKQIIGRFRAVEHNWWKYIDDIRDFDAYWGGETAGALYTKFLNPEVATIYVMGEPRELIIKNKMRKDPHGNIEIIKAFWDLGDQPTYYGRIVVPPLLVYADLLATGDPRNIETAKLIYEQEIDGLIREG